MLSVPDEVVLVCVVFGLDVSLLDDDVGEEMELLEPSSTLVVFVGIVFV